MDKTKILLLGIIVGMLIIIGIALLVDREAPQPEGRLEDCFVVAPRIPYYPKVYTLGVLFEEKTEKMDRIMDAESKDNPIARNPISGAYGRCQFIPSTRKYVEKKWKLEIDWNDPEQQGYACERLLREEGDIHWKESRENCKRN